MKKKKKKKKKEEEKKKEKKIQKKKEGCRSRLKSNERKRKLYQKKKEERLKAEKKIITKKIVQIKKSKINKKVGSNLAVVTVTIQNLFTPFCSVLGKDTLQHFPLLGGLGKQS